MNEPNILLASSNCQRMIRNISYILATDAVQLLQDEINRNILGLFQLGIEHLDFALKVPRRQWRQRISRLYYAAYNVRRAVQLAHDGAYNMDASDHRNVGKLPPVFVNGSTYGNQLQVLRNDRNLADYDHMASISDLLISPNDAEHLVNNFILDATQYLPNRGVGI